jgi:hypothetical protein
MMYAGPRVVPRGMSLLAYPDMIPVPPPIEIVSASGPRANAMGYGGYGDLEGAGATAALIGIGLGTIVLTIGAYVLLAYGVGWGASKGWQKAKKK